MLANRFTIGYYFTAVNRMLASPRGYFSQMPAEADLGRPLGVLLVSSLLFAAASLTYGAGDRPLVMGAVYFVNAAGMTLIAAALGYMAMVMIMGRKASFARLFRVYALAAGVTLLAAWVPFFLMMTEPWKWWLIGVGMTRSLGFSRRQALMVIAVSAGTMILLFRSLLPLLAR